MRLVYLDSARDDLAEILKFIATESGDVTVALAFVERIRNRFRRLAELGGKLGSARPELGNDIRSTPLAGYVLFFRYRPGTIEAIDILHGSRDIVDHRWPASDVA